MHHHWLFARHHGHGPGDRHGHGHHHHQPHHRGPFGHHPPMMHPGRGFGHPAGPFPPFPPNMFNFTTDNGNVQEQIRRIVENFFEGRRHHWGGRGRRCHGRKGKTSDEETGEESGDSHHRRRCFWEQGRNSEGPHRERRWHGWVYGPCAQAGRNAEEAPEGNEQPRQECYGWHFQGKGRSDEEDASTSDEGPKMRRRGRRFHGCHGRRGRRCCAPDEKKKNDGEVSKEVSDVAPPTAPMMETQPNEEVSEVEEVAASLEKSNLE